MVFVHTKFCTRQTYQITPISIFCACLRLGRSITLRAGSGEMGGDHNPECGFLQSMMIGGWVEWETGDRGKGKGASANLLITL